MLNYNEFVKRNHVTKAVRFELIPQGKTMESITEHGDMEADKRMYKSLERMKPVIDSLIRDITRKALLKVDFDFRPMYEAKLDKNKKAYSKEVKDLSKAIENAVKDVMPGGRKISEINSAKFLQEDLYAYVESGADKDIKKGEALADIEETKGCLALFNKFLTSRITALSTWMPDRVAENFDIYCCNIPKIEAVLKAEGLTDGMKDELSRMADISYYSQVLSQTDIDGYNNIISGSCDENGTTFKGFNQRINEYNTAVRNEKKDLPYLKKIDTLHKQILMPSEKKFVIETISTDDEVRTVVRETWVSFKKAAGEASKLLSDKGTGEGILVQGNRLHKLSHILSGDHQLIASRIIERESNEISQMLNTGSLKASMKKELEKRLELVSSQIANKSYEMSSLDEFVQNEDKSILGTPKTAFGCYVEAYNTALSTAETYYKILEGGNIFGNRHIKGDRHVQEMLVDFFGVLTDVRDILSIIRLPKEETGDVVFYNALDEVSGDIRASYKAENLVRNYITKSVKDTSPEKQTMLGTTARLRTQWWNGEKKFSKDHAAIVEHEGKYYYFILSGDAKPVSINIKEDGDAGFLTLKKGQKSFMMLPKILFTDNAVPFFEKNKDAKEFVLDNDQVMSPVTVTADVYRIYKDGLFKREAVAAGTITEDEYKANIAKLIDVYKAFAGAYVQYAKFNMEGLNDTGSYNDIGEFFSDVDTHTSNLSWTKVSFGMLEGLVDNGEAYLFLIINRFLYTGKEDKNQYTKMLMAILSPENMKDTTILLNSNPAVYFRPQSVKREVTHKTGSFLVNRRTEDGEPIPKDIYETIYKIKNGISSYEDKDYKAAMEYMDTHKVRVFRAKMDMVYNKRYMEDKFILQLTYTKNVDVSDRTMDRLNDRVLESIKDGFNIVSVARSTNDMVYVMALDDKMNILEECSLNVIDGIDYAALLHDAYKEKLGDKKKSWVYDTDSSDLKSAYVDTAITEILKLAMKYNAIIAVESINDNVKDKYSFLDNQVFKKFENRIAERLSDLSFKNIPDGKPGSVSNPLQLANNNGNGYQDGILFFVNNAYTRGVDPASGFANIFDLTRMNSIQAKRQFFAKMEDIRVKGDCIDFKFDFAGYPVRYSTEKTKWDIRLQGDVVIYDREKKTDRLVHDMVNKVLLPLAKDADLSGNLAEKMIGREIPGVFVEELFKQFKYALTGIHRKTKESSELFKSPVSGTEYSVCHVSALNLARKLRFRINYEGETSKFTEGWLNHIQ